MNKTLFKREFFSSLKLLLIFIAVITMYVSIVIMMYDPKLSESLKTFEEMMPGIMSAIGMTNSGTTLTSFMISYLYGFILLVFPMIFTIIKSVSLVSKYVENGSMANIIGAPIQRKKVIVTQLMVLYSCITLLIVYATGLEYIIAAISFKGQLALDVLLKINLGLYSLHILIATICMLGSIIFNEVKQALIISAGIPVLMYIFTMIQNVSDKLKGFKYFSIFTLFDPTGLSTNTKLAFIKIGIMLVAGCIIETISIQIFTKKDMHI